MKKKLSIEPNAKNISDLCKTFQEKFNKSLTPSSHCDLKTVPFRSFSLGFPWKPLRKKIAKGASSPIKEDQGPLPFVIRGKINKKNTRETATKFSFLESALISFRFVPFRFRRNTFALPYKVPLQIKKSTRQIASQKDRSFLKKKANLTKSPIVFLASVKKLKKRKRSKTFFHFESKFLKQNNFLSPSLKGSYVAKNKRSRGPATYEPAFFFSIAKKKETALASHPLQQGSNLEHDIRKPYRRTPPFFSYWLLPFVGLLTLIPDSKLPTLPTDLKLDTLLLNIKNETVKKKENSVFPKKIAPFVFSDDAPERRQNREAALKNRVFITRRQSYGEATEGKQGACFAPPSVLASCPSGTSKKGKKQAPPEKKRVFLTNYESKLCRSAKITSDVTAASPQSVSMSKTQVNTEQFSSVNKLEFPTLSYTKAYLLLENIMKKQINGLSISNRQAVARKGPLCTKEATSFFFKKAPPILFYHLRLKSRAFLPFLPEGRKGRSYLSKNTQKHPHGVFRTFYGPMLTALPQFQKKHTQAFVESKGSDTNLKFSKSPYLFWRRLQKLNASIKKPKKPISFLLSETELLNAVSQRRPRANRTLSTNSLSLLPRRGRTADQSLLASKPKGKKAGNAKEHQSLVGLQLPFSLKKDKDRIYLQSLLNQLALFRNLISDVLASSPKSLKTRGTSKTPPVFESLLRNPNSIKNPFFKKDSLRRGVASFGPFIFQNKKRSRAVFSKRGFSCASLVFAAARRARRLLRYRASFATKSTAFQRNLTIASRQKSKIFDARASVEKPSEFIQGVVSLKNSLDQIFVSSSFKNSKKKQGIAPPPEGKNYLASQGKGLLKIGAKHNMKDNKKIREDSYTAWLQNEFAFLDNAVRLASVLASSPSCLAKQALLPSAAKQAALPSAAKQEGRTSMPPIERLKERNYAYKSGALYKNPCPSLFHGKKKKTSRIIKMQHPILKSGYTFAVLTKFSVSEPKLREENLCKPPLPTKNRGSTKVLKCRAFQPLLALLPSLLRNSKQGALIKKDMTRASDFQTSKGKASLISNLFAHSFLLLNNSLHPSAVKETEFFRKATLKKTMPLLEPFVEGIWKAPCSAFLLTVQPKTPTSDQRFWGSPLRGVFRKAAHFFKAAESKRRQWESKRTLNLIHANKEAIKMASIKKVSGALFAARGSNQEWTPFKSITVVEAKERETNNLRPKIIRIRKGEIKIRIDKLFRCFLFPAPFGQHILPTKTTRVIKNLKPSRGLFFINHFLPLPLFLTGAGNQVGQNQKLFQKPKSFKRGYVKKRRAFFGALASFGEPSLLSKQKQGVQSKLRSSPLTKDKKDWVRKGDEGLFPWPHKTPQTERFSFLIRKSEPKEHAIHNKKEDNLLFKNRFDFSKTDVNSLFLWEQKQGVSLLDSSPSGLAKQARTACFFPFLLGEASAARSARREDKQPKGAQSNSTGPKNALLFRSEGAAPLLQGGLASLQARASAEKLYNITKNAIKNSKKKRRALKQKRETGRLLKRKRFHPRPAWLRVTMHKKLLKYRHIKNNNFALLPFGCFFRAKQESEGDGLLLPLRGQASTPVKLRLSPPLRASRPKGGQRNKDRKKHPLFAAQAITAEKEFYSISQSVFAAFQQGLWKSSWLRSNLNSYLRKIKTSFNLIKQTSQNSELGFSTKKIISDCLGLTKAPYEAPYAESEPRFAGATPWNGFTLQKSLIFDAKQKARHPFALFAVRSKPSSLGKKQPKEAKAIEFEKNFSKWNTVLQIAEYNQITYHRIQQIITNMKHSLGREGAKRTSADSLSKVSLNKGSFIGNPALLRKEEHSFMSTNQAPNTFINNIATKPGPFDPKKHRPFNNAHHKLKRQATEGSASKPSKKAEPFLEPSTFSFNLFNFVNTVIQTPGSLKSRIHQQLKEQPFFTIQTFGNMSQKRVYWALNKTHMWHFKNSNKKEYLWANQKQREQNRSNKTKKIIKKFFTLPLQEQYPGTTVVNKNQNNKNQKRAEVGTTSFAEKPSILQQKQPYASAAKTNVEKWKEQNQKSLNTFFKKQEQKEIKMGDLGFLDSNGPHSNLLFIKDLFANSFKKSYNPNYISFFDEATGSSTTKQESFLFNRKAGEHNKKHSSEAARAFFERKKVPVFIKEHKMFLRNLKNTLRVSSPLEKATNSTPLKMIKLSSQRERATVFQLPYASAAKTKGALLSSLIWSSPKSYSQMGADAQPWGGVEVGAKSINYVRHNFLTVPLLRYFSFLPFTCQKPLLAARSKQKGALIKRHTLIKKGANTRFMRLALGGNYSTPINLKIPTPFLRQAKPHKGQFFLSQSAFLLCTIIFHLCSLFSLVSLSQIRCVIKFILLLVIKLSSFVKIFRQAKPFKHRTLLMAPKIRLRKVPKSSPFFSRSSLKNPLLLLPKCKPLKGWYKKGLASQPRRGKSSPDFLEGSTFDGKQEQKKGGLKKSSAFFRQGAKKMPLAFFLTKQRSFWVGPLSCFAVRACFAKQKSESEGGEAAEVSSCFFDKKNEKRATKLNTFLKVGSKKLGFVLHTGLSKVTDIRNTGTKSVSVFLGKPGESLSVWINHLFLIEIAADSTTTIPENSDTSLWNSYAKLAKSSSTTPILGTLLEKRLLSSFEFFLERVSQPDTDLIVRQRKGTIFLDNLLFRTSPALKNVSESEGNQRSSLREVLPSFLALLKIAALPEGKQSFFSRRRITDHRIFDWTAKHVGGLLLPLRGQAKAASTAAPSLKELQNTGNSKVLLLDTRVRKRWSANQFSTFKGKDSDLLIHAPPAPKSFHSLYPSPFLLRQASPSISQTKQAPAGKLLQRHYNFNAEGIAPLGTIVCQIYSGIFSKETAKSCLVVGKASSNYDEKSLLIQSLAGETEMKIIRDNANRYNFALGIKSLRNVFDALALHTPCIFLIEDIHVIGERRPLLVGDDENARAESFGESHDEKNLSVAKLTRHSIMHYRKPFRGDFSSLIPANNFSFDLFLKNDFTNKAQTLIATKTPLKKPKNSLDELPWMGGLVLFQKSTSPLVVAPQPTKAPSSLLREPKERSKKRSRSGRSSCFAAEAPTIFSKEPEVQKGLLKIKNSIRIKIALLANSAVSNLSVKLNMITDLLVIIDGVRSNRGFVVFATTHIPSSLDPALRRPGRLDETIVLPFLPKLESRWEIVKAHFARSTQNAARSEAIASSDSFLYKSGGPLTPSLSFNLDFGFLTHPFLLGEASAASFGCEARREGSLLSKNVQQAYLEVPFERLSKSKLKHVKGKTQSKSESEEEQHAFSPTLKAEYSSSNLLNLVATAYSKIGKLLINNKFANCAETNLSLFSTLHCQLKNQQNQIHTLEPYLHLYTTQNIVKLFLMGLFAPKVAETFAFSDLNKKRSLEKITGPLLLPSDSKASSIIFSLIEKKLIYKKNVIIPRLLQFSNAALLSPQEPSGEATFVLLPARRYGSYKQTFLAMQKLMGNPSLPSDAESKVLNVESDLSNSDSDLGLMVEKQSLVTRGEFFDRPTLINGHYRNKVLNRHRGYLTNQWWNGHLYEHNVETTFLGDIDWRSNCFASKASKKGRPLKFVQAEETTPTKTWENFYVDFPDSDSHYNSNNRRWVLHFGYWSYWSNYKTAHNREIYSFMVTESFLETFNYLNSNREILDFFVTRIIKSGSLKDINVVEGLKRFENITKSKLAH